jgi:hypothetical protein
VAIRPSVPEIITVNSEDLQTQIRDLLPSQNGFGSELQATNVITPIIDLTAAAEGSTLPAFLQTAWDFSTGHTSISNTTSTLITNTGFWKVDAAVSFNFGASGVQSASIQLDDGLSTKVIYEINAQGNTSASTHAVNQDQFYVFLRAGDSLTATTNSSDVKLDVVYRPVADINGNLILPLNFSAS